MFDTMVVNLQQGVITISHAMFILGIWVLFQAWNWRSDYLSPFGWYILLLALTNTELSKNVLYQL